MEKALEYFKDWSNYLLVTTVAMMGWTATTKDLVFNCQAIRSACIWSFALSAIFGIFTLALIPLVAEQRGDTDVSFYDLNIKFRLLGIRFSKMRIKFVCLPQHAWFILGVVLFAAGIC